MGGMDWNEDMVIALIGGNMFCVFYASVFLYAIVSNNKLNKKITLWLEDAIQLRAFTMRLDTISLKYKPYQLQVNFEFDGKIYQRISAPGNIIKGYHKIFKKYADRYINILYSPKYDEVLILKDTKTK